MKTKSLKKIVCFFAITMATTLIISSCSKDEVIPTDVRYTVSFETNGGAEIDSVQVCENTSFNVLPVATKQGFVFVYWCSDKELTQKFDASTPIKKNTKLYAKFDMPFDLELKEIKDPEGNVTDRYYILKGFVESYRNQINHAVIPDAIYEPTSKKMVDIREIAAGAFKPGENPDFALATIVVGAKVKIIYGGAFTGLPSLRKVSFASGSELVELADKAFERAYALVDIKLPESLQKIGRRAFCGCAKLPQITIPVNIKNIGREAFAGCQELQNVYMMPQTAPDMKDNSDVAAKDNSATIAGDRIFGELGDSFTKVSGILMYNAPGGTALNIWVPKGSLPAYTTEEYKKNGNTDPSKVIIVHDRDGSRKDCFGGQWNYYNSVAIQKARFREMN